jgi:hypothetical protein
VAARGACRAAELDDALQHAPVAHELLVDARLVEASGQSARCTETGASGSSRRRTRFCHSASAVNGASGAISVETRTSAS